MSIDLLSLGLAAAMPLLVFAVYAWTRSLLEARARRPTGRRRAGRSRSVSDRSDAIAAATVRPPAGPEPARGILAKLTTSRPAVESSSLRGTSVPAALPATNGNLRAQRSPSATDLPRFEERPSSLAGRPYHAHPAMPSANGASDATPPGDRQRLVVGEPGAAAPTVVSRLGHALRTSTLRPIRTILGRREHDRGPIEPQWPDLDPPVASFQLFDFVEDAGEPCPVCAESRDRGAPFCRRCGRALDERSRAAAVPMWSSAVTLAPAPFPPFEARSTRPGAGPPVAGPPHSLPLTASPPVVQPARYVPAAVPAATETPAPRETPPPSDARIEVASAAVAAAAPAVPRKAAHRAAVKKGAAKDLVTKDVVAKDVVAKVARNRSAAERAKRSRAPDAPPDVASGGATRETVDLNNAAAAQLSALRGVGQKTAERIIAAREERPFATIEALTERKIIGRVALEKLRDQVTVRRRRR
jgi:competence ComEA-like helix-hairpin-helix protein